MGNSASSLPYTISSETHPPTRPGSYGWALHTATRKSDSLPVTVFKATKSTLLKTPLNKRDTRDPSQNQFLCGVHHFRKSKTLVHPNLLKVYATLDTDHPNGDTPDLSAQCNPANPNFDKSILTTGDLIIVTERCVPLMEYMDSLPAGDRSNATKIAWGLHNVINALAFLHNTAKLAHGAVCPHSIYVTPGGDFKLANFAILTPIGIEDGGGGPTRHFRHFEGNVCPREYRSPERGEGRWDAVSTSAVHVMDAYSLGTFIEHLYGHPGAGTNGRVPDKLVKAVQRLSTANIRMRPRVLPLLKCPVFDDPYVHANDFLDNMAVKPAEEKIRFVQSLPDVLSRGVLGRDVAVHKVLPVLVGSVTAIAGTEGSMAQDVNRREVLAAVPPLFQIAETHLLDDPDEFKSQIAPIIDVLFAINDRGVRGALLARVNLLSTHLDGPTLNSSVFEPMCSGFTDSSAALRELTLKSAVALVPHLTPANLEKLVRYLIRLQSDPEPSIRTNTAIFIGKVAPNLSDISRQKLILPAFQRAMKDDFTPCRLAALRAVHSCKDYYGPMDVSTKVMPAVVSHLLDGNSDVRAEAFQVVDSFMVTLRMESANMAEEERRRAAENDEFATSSGGAPMSGGGGGGGVVDSSGAPGSGSASYLASFGSWAASKVTTSAQGGAMDGGGGAAGHIGNMPGGAGGSRAVTAPSRAAPPAAAPYAQQPPRSPPRQQQQQPPAPAFASLSLSDANIGGGGGAIDSGKGGWSDEDDDDWGDGPGQSAAGSTAVGQKQQSTAATAVSKFDEEDEEDFFSSFGASTSKPGGALKIGGLKTSSAGAAGRRAGGGGGGKLVVSSGSSKGGNKPSAAEKKAEFARRKAEREKQKQAKAAAATKLNADEGLDDGWDDF